jgi:hypothetical protein
MAVHRISPQAAPLDVLDRVLDKGIVIDAWVKISLAGIELVGLDARVIVASIDTYMRLAGATTAAATAAAVPGSAARPGRTAPSAVPAAPRRARPRPRRASRRGVTLLRCERGCGFTESGGPPPRDVRCPYEAGRACRLQPA